MVHEFKGQRVVSSFRCGYCKTRIDFADAAPEWQEEPKRKAEREAAAAWVERFAGREIRHDLRWRERLEGEDRDFASGVWEHGAYIRADWEGKVLTDLNGDPEMRAFPCPTCNAWIRPTDGIAA